MAARCTKPPCAVLRLSFSVARPSLNAVGVKMTGSGGSPGRRRGGTTRSIQIRSSNDNKVFEDQSEGIVCYVDDAGETVCEGYDDERPRVLREPPNRRSGEAKIIGLLQRNWIQLVDARDVYPADNRGFGGELPELEDRSNGNRYNSN